MTDLDVLERLQYICGGRIYTVRPSLRYPTAKPIWQWSLTRRKNVVPLLEALQPLMCARRGRKVAEVLQYAKEHPLKYKGLVHGTRNGYKWHGCRCTECREVEATYARNRRKAKKPAASADQPI